MLCDVRALETYFYAVADEITKTAVMVTKDAITRRYKVTIIIYNVKY